MLIGGELFQCHPGPHIRPTKQQKKPGIVLYLPGHFDGSTGLLVGYTSPHPYRKVKAPTANRKFSASRALKTSSTTTSHAAALNSVAASFTRALSPLLQLPEASNREEKFMRPGEMYPPKSFSTTASTSTAARASRPPRPHPGRQLPVGLSMPRLLKKHASAPLKSTLPIISAYNGHYRNSSPLRTMQFQPSLKPGGSEGNHRDLSRALATIGRQRYTIPDLDLGYPFPAATPSIPLAELPGGAGHSGARNTARRRSNSLRSSVPSKGLIFEIFEFVAFYLIHQRPSPCFQLEHLEAHCQA
ncbi:MAG: hypothetical protein PWQ91_1046 [Eubacteriales bacterium]|nr:hypothetical protein [Eubacteriales bacterium]